MIDIIIALVLGAWLAIAFDTWTLDAYHDAETESVGYYLGQPWQTLKRFWGIIADEPTE